MYRVMIADDEYLVRKAMETLINWTELNCDLVLLGENGRQILENLEKYSPDIIITDIKMPEVTGIDVAKYISETFPHIKVIFLTGFADFSYAKAGIQYNVVDYVSKTGDFDLVVNAIKKAISLIEESKLTKTDIQSMRRTFFKDIFDGLLVDDTELKRRGQTLKLFQKKFALAYVTAIHLAGAQSKLLQELLATYIEKEYNHQTYDFSLETVTMTQTSAVIVFYSKKDSLKLEHTDVIKFCQTISDLNVDSDMSIIHFGISEIVYNFENLKTACEHSQKAHAFCFYDAHKALNLYRGKSLQDISLISSELQLLASDFLSCILNADLEGANETENLICTIIKERRIEAKSVIFFIIEIINRCKAILTKKELNSLQLNALIPKDWEIETLLYDFTCCTTLLSKVKIECIKTIKDSFPHSVDVVDEAKKYIDLHYCENFSLEKIALHIGVNPSYLSRIFSDKMNIPIVKYSNNLKIQQAQLLLSNSNMSILDIANSVGIENFQYFCKLFKKHTRESPSSWRKKYHK